MIRSYMQVLSEDKEILSNLLQSKAILFHETFILLYETGLIA